MHSTETLCILQLCEGRYPEIIHKALEPLSYLGEVEILELYSNAENNLTSVALVGQTTPIQEAVILIAKRARDMFNIQNYKGPKSLQGVIPSIAWHPLTEKNSELAISFLAEFGKALEQESGIPVVIHKNYPQIVDNFLPIKAISNSHPTAGFTHLFKYNRIYNSDLETSEQLPYISKILEKAKTTIEQNISWRTFFHEMSKLSSTSSLILPFHLLTNRTQQKSNYLKEKKEWITAKSELLNLICECEASEERWHHVQEKQAEYIPRHLEEEALAFQVRSILLRHKFCEIGAILYSCMNEKERGIPKEIFVVVFQEIETLLESINDKAFGEYMRKEIREKKTALGVKL